MRFSAIRLQNGFSLIEALISLAVLGAMIAAMASLYKYAHGQLADSEGNREAESIRTQVQGLLDQPGVCDRIIRDGKNQLIGWDLSNMPAAAVPVPALWYSPTAGVQGKTLFFVSQKYSRLLTVQNIYLREPTTYEGGIARSQQSWGPTTLTTVVAKLVIMLQEGTGNSPRLIQRTADVVLGINTNTKLITRCMSALTASPVQLGQAFQCGPGNVNGKTCPSTGGDYFCSQFYYVDGFDNTGTPRCSCALSCVSGPQGDSGGGGTTVVGGSSSSGGNSGDRTGNSGSGDTAGGVSGDAGAGEGDGSQ